MTNKMRFTEGEVPLKCSNGGNKDFPPGHTNRIFYSFDQPEKRNVAHLDAFVRVLRTHLRVHGQSGVNKRFFSISKHCQFVL